MKDTSSFEVYHLLSYHSKVCTGPASGPAGWHMRGDFSNSPGRHVIGYYTNGPGRDGKKRKTNNIGSQSGPQNIDEVLKLSDESLIMILI